MGKGRGADGGSESARRRGPAEEGGEAQGEGEAEEQEGLVCNSVPSRAHRRLSHVHCRDERKEQVATAMAAKQKKRADNIASRNERRNDKRKGVKPKDKGRPGFEGKSFGKGKGKSGSGKSSGKK